MVGVQIAALNELQRFVVQLPKLLETNHVDALASLCWKSCL